MARRAPMMAALACSRSWQVSTMMASTPPRSRPAAHCLIGVAQLGEPGVAERGQLGARPDRAQHPARPLRRGPPVRRFPGDPGARLGQLGDPAGYPVLAQVAEVRAERVGGDAVDPGLEVAVMHRADHVRPGDVEDLVTAFVAVEIADGGRARLQHGPHRAIRHDHPLGRGRLLSVLLPGRPGGVRHSDPYSSGDACLPGRPRRTRPQRPGHRSAHRGARNLEAPEERGRGGGGVIELSGVRKLTSPAVIAGLRGLERCRRGSQRSGRSPGHGVAGRPRSAPSTRRTSTTSR